MGCFDDVSPSCQERNRIKTMGQCAARPEDKIDDYDEDVGPRGPRHVHKSAKDGDVIADPNKAKEASGSAVAEEKTPTTEKR